MRAAPAPRARGGSSLFRAVAEVVEGGDAVGFGPHADGARAGNVVVVELDVGLAVQRDANAPAGELYAQRMPGIGRNGRIRILERPAAPRLGVVERDVVFKSIGAGDVVVVGVLPAPEDTARPVLGPGEGLELHFHEPVLDGGLEPDAPGKGSRARLLQDVRLARRRRVALDCPARRPAACDTLQ